MKKPSPCQKLVLAWGLVKCVKRTLDVQGKVLTEDVHLLGHKLLDGLFNRFGNREKIDLIAQSVFLDPRFRVLG